MQGGEVGAYLPSILAEANLSQVSLFLRECSTPHCSTILPWKTKLFAESNC